MKVHQRTHLEGKPYEYNPKALAYHRLHQVHRTQAREKSMTIISVIKPLHVPVAFRYVILERNTDVFMPGKTTGMKQFILEMIQCGKAFAQQSVVLSHEETLLPPVDCFRHYIWSEHT